MHRIFHSASWYAGVLLLFAGSASAGGQSILSFSPDRTTYAIGESALLSWSSANVSYCLAIGAWSGPRATEGVYRTPPLTKPGKHTYGLSCMSPDGSTVQRSVTIGTADARLVVDSFDDFDGTPLVSHLPDRDATGTGWGVTGRRSRDTAGIAEVRGGKLVIADRNTVASVDTGRQDVSIQCEWKPRENDRAFLIGRRSAPGDHLQVLFKSGSSLVEIEGLQSENTVELATGSAELSPGVSHTISARFDGQVVTALVDGKTVATWVQTSAFSFNGTSFGIAHLDGVQGFDNCVIQSLGAEQPAEDPNPARDARLMLDSFNDPNGTALASHIPDIDHTGMGWSVSGRLTRDTAGKAEIHDGRLVIASPNTVASINIGQFDASIQCDWNPDDNDRAFLIGRRAGPGSQIQVLFKASKNRVEIEGLHADTAVELAVGSADLASGSVHTIGALFDDHVVKALVNGTTVATWEQTGEFNFNGTEFGIAHLDGAQSFDNCIVQGPSSNGGSGEEPQIGGELVEYTLEVPRAGDYLLEFQVMTASGGPQLATVPVSLAAGRQVIRVGVTVHSQDPAVVLDTPRVVIPDDASNPVPCDSCDDQSTDTQPLPGTPEQEPQPGPESEPEPEPEPVPEPSVALTSAADVVVSGEPVTLSWVSSNAEQCTAGGGWSGAKPGKGTQELQPITARADYRLTCKNSSGNAVSMISVAVKSETVLSWQPPTRNEDGSELTDLAGYRVYYGSSSGDYANFVEINEGASSHTIELPSGDYYFAMTAMNSEGVESGYSNEIMKTFK